jgi:hypothetical protein
MEKVVSKRKIIKTVEEEVEMEIYISKDGTVFDIEEECVEHERQLDFLTYFNTKYKVKTIDIQEYGLNFGHPLFCHLVYVKKISDKVIDDFIEFYELKDHPEDISKIKEGWSFVALVSDVNQWIFNQSDREFIVENLDDIKNLKKKELTLLEQLV